MNISTLLPYLDKVKQRNGQYEAACPVCHSDHHLYVKDAGDKVLIHCQKCEAGYAEVLEALGIDDKQDEKPVEIEHYDHIYRRPDGSIQYAKTRIKYSNGKKKFSFHYTDESGKKHFTKPEDANALYNLDALQRAEAKTRLYIVEGEKCVDALTRAGCLATTTNTGGGNGTIKFTDVDRELLGKFRDKVIIPDNDEVGEKYCKHFPDAKILRLADIWADIGPKGDIADYLLRGLPIEAVKNYDFKEETPVSDMTKEQIINKKVFEKLVRISDGFERQQAVAEFQVRATALGMRKAWDNLWKTFQMSFFKANRKSGQQTSFVDQPVVLDCGEWTATNAGVYKTEMQNGDIRTIYASAIPILPTELLTNDDTGIDKIRIAYYRDNKWRDVIVERATAANNSKIVDLANKGIEVTSDNAKALVKYLSECVTRNLEALPHRKAISRLGWVDNCFMPYDEGLVFDGEKENKYIYGAVTQKGSLELWVEKMRDLRGKSMYFRLQMDASFASVLVERVHALPFVFHLWGGTGSGKTVGLMAAMSVWGNPRMGKMCRTMNMTANSMLSTAAFLCHLPFAGDELQTIKSKWENYDSLIMRLTEGVDRGRMSYDKNKEIRSWKNAFLFTGEEPCTKQGSGGGVKNRVIEIECVNSVVKNGNEVVSFVNENYGYAGVEFIKNLRNEENLQEQYNELFSAVMLFADSTEKQAMSMALILLADRLAEKYLFGGEALDATDVKQFLCSVKEVDVSERAYEFIINLIAQRKENFTPSANECWGRIEGKEVLFDKFILTRELSNAGFEFDAVKRKWRSSGKIVPGNDGKLRTVTTVNGVQGIYIRVKIVKTTL